MNDKSIGVFDSGMGGLTVLKALKETMPNESFIYLGDTARLPYGTKSQHTVVAYAKQMASYLHAQDIKALIIACNTATTAALDVLQTIYSDIPVVGVIKPGSEAALASTSGKGILVLATETTVRSRIYQQTIQTLSPKQPVFSAACGLFVSLAEEGWIDNKVTHQAIKQYLSPFNYQDIDTVLLGCTHFPVLKAALQAYLGKKISIVDSAHATAACVLQVLKSRQQLAMRQVAGEICYWVTDLPERFCQVGEVFLEQGIEPKQVQLLDI